MGRVRCVKIIENKIGELVSSGCGCGCGCVYAYMYCCNSCRPGGAGKAVKALVHLFYRTDSLSQVPPPSNIKPCKAKGIKPCVLTA